MLLSTITDPIIVSKHEDVGADGFAALRTLRYVFSFKGLSIDLNLVHICLIYLPVTRALEVHNAAMTFNDTIIGETCLTEMIVNIAREDEIIAIHELFTDL